MSPILPVMLPFPIQRLSQAEFGEISYDVMRHVFAIHTEIGRFFDEDVYKHELARRLPETRLESPIDVTFDSFHKRYYLDVVVRDGAVFEFKSVDALVGRHRAQLLNYLFLCDLAHGKLINVRAEIVEHEFVNTQRRRAECSKFETNVERWDSTIPGAFQFREYLEAALRDLGTGLEVALYEDLLTHFLGGIEQCEAEARIWIGGREAGRQRLRMMAPGVALKITCLDHGQNEFEIQTRRLLAHVDLQAIAWINITMNQLTMTTLRT